MKLLFQDNQIKLGLGTWQMGMRGWGNDYDEGSVKESLKFLIKNGIKFIDTAEIYGNGKSERNISEVIKEFHRKELIIATKIAGSNFKPSKIGKRLVGSLKRLNTDYIDLYQVHWEPSAYTNLAESFKELEKLAKDGLIEHIGVSNFTSEKIEFASNVLKDFPIESNQIKYNIIELPPEKELEYLRQHNIKIIAWSPLAQGFLTGKYNPGNLPKGFIRKVNKIFNKQNMAKFNPLIDFLKSEAQIYKVSPTSIVLAYEIQKGVLPIPGFKNMSQAKDIINSLSLRLSNETLERINDLSKDVVMRYKIGFYPALLPNFIVNLIVKFI